jgi:hypothetical protein
LLFDTVPGFEEGVNARLEAELRRSEKVRRSPSRSWHVGCGAEALAAEKAVRLLCRRRR